MVRTMLIATVIVGIGGFSVCPSLASFFAPSQMEQPQMKQLLRSTEKEKVAPAIELAIEQVFQSHRYLVQRESSKPPGESHSGRASSSPAGKIPESKRDSGRTLDLSEDPAPHEFEGTSQQRPEESMAPPKREGDPLEGERKSQPAFKRRGGVVP